MGLPQNYLRTFDVEHSFIHSLVDSFNNRLLSFRALLVSRKIAPKDIHVLLPGF